MRIAHYSRTLNTIKGCTVKHEVFYSKTLNKNKGCTEKHKVFYFRTLYFIAEEFVLLELHTRN